MKNLNKKIREAIDYGNYPERMDPSLERKLSDPESDYAKSPAMRKGAQDVERLVTNRFKEVVDRLRRVTGINDLSSIQVKRMLIGEMMNSFGQAQMIERGHKDELEQLSIEAVLKETGTPEDWYVIDARLAREPIRTDDFRYREGQPTPDEDEEDDENEEEPTSMPSMDFNFDIENLTEDEIFELEKHKRNMINAMIQGTAKKGHYVFQQPWVKQRLDAIDRRLYDLYLRAMAINDFCYFTQEAMIEQMSESGIGVAGKVTLQPNNKKNDDEDTGDDNDDDYHEGQEEQSSENTPDTKILAEGAIFPILCHEIFKGIEEAKARFGYPQDTEMARRVLSHTDTLQKEPMQLRIGPQIVEKIRFALPDRLFETQNVGLLNWFHISLYQIPAEEFLQIIGDVISEDQTKLQKGQRRFEEILSEAEDLKNQYDEWKKSKDEEMDDEPQKPDGDDDDLDDFLKGLGIDLPD